MRVPVRQVIGGAALVVGVLVPTAPLGAVPPPPTWHEGLSSQGPSVLSSVRCNAAGGCVLFGSWNGAVSPGTLLFRSDDLGASWGSIAGPTPPPVGSTSPFDPGPSAQDQASCGSASFCMVELRNGGTNDFFVTSNDGQTWSAVRDIPRGLGYHVTGLTCPAAGTCLADDDGELLATTDGGGHWTLRGNGATLIALSCPAASACYELERVTTQRGAILRVLRTSDLGVTTHEVATFPDGSLSAATPPAQLDCPSARACGVAVEGIGVGPRVLHTTADAGLTWATHALPAGRGFGGFACGSGSACALLDFTPGGGTVSSVSTRDAGATWTTRTMTENPSAPFTLGSGAALACPTPGTCFALDPFVNFDQDHDLFRMPLARPHWIDEGVGGAPAYDSVACDPSNECVAVGGSGEATSPDEATSSDGGMTWSQSTGGELSDLYFADVSCPFDSTCFAAGVEPAGHGSAQGAIYVTRDGGEDWTPGSVPAGVTGASDVACATTSTCLAVPQGAAPIWRDVLRTTDGGTTWSTVAVGSAMNGATFDAVTCPSATECIGVGSELSTQPGLQLVPMAAVSSDAGATWTLYPQSSIVGWDPFSSISCTSTTDCIATYSGEGPTEQSWTSRAYVTTDGGQTWAAAGDLPGPQGAVVEGCRGSTCWGIGFNEPCPAQQACAQLDESTDGGSTWVAEAAPSDVVRLDQAALAPSGAVVGVGVNLTNGPVLVTLTP